MKIVMNPNEMVVKAADSSLVSNGNEVKGKLILTTQRIYFSSEANGNGSDNLEIYPKDIEDVMFFKNRMLFSNGLNIITRDGNQNKFLIKNRANWSELIVRMV
ncbi:MAG: hypothetical protein K9G76_11780 [Bacteroidales bacterium]|nr:hypothetical protein [Bacteroidales bacterium]MCF8405122.1 hypothetical protein [Bacteroidales bacterium]